MAVLGASQKSSLFIGIGRMGLVDGDVVQSINGQPLAATTDMKRFYEGIKTAGTVSLVIRRGQSLEALQFKVQ